MRKHVLEGVRGTAALAVTEREGRAERRLERLAEVGPGGPKSRLRNFQLVPKAWGRVFVGV